MSSSKREQANERARRARERQRDVRDNAWKIAPPVVAPVPKVVQEPPQAAPMSDEVARMEAEKRGITPGAAKLLGLTAEQALALKIPLETMDHDDHGIRRPGFSYSTSQPTWTWVRTIDGGF